MSCLPGVVDLYWPVVALHRIRHVQFAHRDLLSDAAQQHNTNRKEQQLRFNLILMMYEGVNSALLTSIFGCVHFTRSRP